MAEHFSQEDLERISEFTEAMRLATQGVHANVEANKTEEQRARDQAIKAAKIQAKKIEEENMLQVYKMQPVHWAI